MAVADLQEAELARLGGERPVDDPERTRDAPRHGPQHAGPGPGHAFQEFPPFSVTSLMAILRVDMTIKSGVGPQLFLHHATVRIPAGGCGLGRQGGRPRRIRTPRCMAMSRNRKHNPGKEWLLLMTEKAPATKVVGAFFAS